jgi:hypothetical protein
MVDMSRQLRDILVFGRMYWPHIRFYDRQREMIESVALNTETCVVAGNQLGKDFAAAFIALTFFLRPQLFFQKSYVEQIEQFRRPNQPEYAVHTTKVITTSVKEEHLTNLWGELGRLLSSAESPLLDHKGGPLVANYQEIRWREEKYEAGNPLCYLKGMVSKSGEGFSGAHANYTLCIMDEASAIEPNVYVHSQGWAKKFLIFGNPWPCPRDHFFRRSIEKGDVE